MRRVFRIPWPLLLCGAALAAADPPQPADRTPAEQYQALAKKYDDAQQEFFKVYQEAKTDEEREKIYKEKYPKAESFAAEFLALAEKHPKDPAAVDALVWVATRARATPARDKALEILARDHVASDRVGPVCQSLVYDAPTEKAEKFLRDVMEKNPNRATQAAACICLAQMSQQAAGWAEGVKKNPENYANVLDKETIARLKEADPAAYRKRAEEMFERVKKDFGDVKSQRGDRTYGDVAEGYLFEIRNLAIGKVAPDIEGEDLDGKKFKLSDYRGKVVVIDFWGNW
jgi:thiol-disulfide isomerase/thioredoxin